MTPDEYPWDDADGDEWDVEDMADMHCGRTDDGLCTMAGTEYCDFECPYRDMLYRTRPPGDGDARREGS